MLTLNQLKVYLQRHGPTSLLKLAKEFSEDPDDIMCIAEHYIDKGKICCQQINSIKNNYSCLTSCSSCPKSCISNRLIKLSWV